MKVPPESRSESQSLDQTADRARPLQAATRLAHRDQRAEREVILERLQMGGQGDERLGGGQGVALGVVWTMDGEAEPLRHGGEPDRLAAGGRGAAQAPQLGVEP